MDCSRPAAGHAKSYSDRTNRNVARSNDVQRIRHHFEVSEWPLVVLTLFCVIMIANLV